MNWDQIQRNWDQLKGQAKLRWSKLGEEQLASIAGRRALLASRIREVYQLSDAETESQLLAWQDSLVSRN
jgi:uncharacterized protein YjbJ (UPF0337 family)